MQFELTETQLNTLYASLISAELYAKKTGAPEWFFEDILDARQTLFNQEEAS